MNKTVITIGREFGSGGHEIGEKLAKKLGYAFFDKELLSLAAQKAGLHEDFVNRQDEKAPGFLADSVVFGARDVYYRQSLTDKVFIEQVNVIREIASRGSCVIVGRCADYFLQESGSVNIFVHSPIATRVERKLAMADEPFSPDKMEKRIAYIDKQRSKFYNYYSDRKWGDARNYHLSVDTSVVGIDGAVEVIAAFLKNMK